MKKIWSSHLSKINSFSHIVEEVGHKFTTMFCLQLTAILFMIFFG